MEGGSGPRGGVHNKQMFILSGFIISDPDCIKLFLSIENCEQQEGVNIDSGHSKPREDLNSKGKGI